MHVQGRVVAIEGRGDDRLPRAAAQTIVGHRQKREIKARWPFEHEVSVVPTRCRSTPGTVGKEFRYPRRDGAGRGRDGGNSNPRQIILRLKGDGNAIHLKRGDLKTGPQPRDRGTQEPMPTQ